MMCARQWVEYDVFSVSLSLSRTLRHRGAGNCWETWLTGWHGVALRCVGLTILHRPAFGLHGLDATQQDRNGLR